MTWQKPFFFIGCTVRPPPPPPSPSRRHPHFFLIFVFFFFSFTCCSLTPSPPWRPTSQILFFFFFLLVLPRHHPLPLWLSLGHCTVTPQPSCDYPPLLLSSLGTAPGILFNFWLFSFLSLVASPSRVRIPYPLHRGRFFSLFFFLLLVAKWHPLPPHLY